METVLHSRSIYTEDGIVSGYLKISQGKIKEISDQVLTGDVYIDVEDHSILPGIIDIHNHGFHGWSAKTIHRQEINGLSSILPSIGVTSALATTSAWRDEEYRMLREISTAIKEGCEGTKMLGIHMEGPFFHPHKHNATSLSEVQSVTLQKIKRYVQEAQGCLMYMTLAPELDGSHEVMDYLKEEGIHIGCGHTEAKYQTFLAAKAHGMETSVHTGNAMCQISQREIGLMGGALLDPDIYCEIICDCFHLSKEMLQLMFLIKRDNRKFIMISDSDILSGAEPGDYWMFEKLVHVHPDGRILLDDGTINGSSKHVLYGMKQLVEELGIPLVDVILMSSLNPATLLGIHKDTGSIKVGKCADLIIIDEQMELQRTYVNGVLKYEKGDILQENPAFARICKRL